MAEELIIDPNLTKKEQYTSLLPQLEALIAGEDDLIANLANIAAVLKFQFNFWWVGFYLIKENELVLAPFQGPLACTRIAIGKGVCGKAAATQTTILVPNVEEFEGHIACSSATKSEIVIPILKNHATIGVLDVDSEYLNHFDADDQFYLEAIAKLISTKIPA
jgi:GAF domain-containing protein